MKLIEFSNQQFQEEGAAIRRFRASVPDDKYEYKPHEKSMLVKYRVIHMSDLP